MRPLLIVETDSASKRLPGLAVSFRLSQMDALPFHRAPQAFDEDIVHPLALAIHGNGYVGVREGWVNSWLVNGDPWSVLKISGTPYLSMASFKAAMQKPVSMVLENQQDSIARLCQYRFVTRYRNPRFIGTCVISAHHT